MRGRRFPLPLFSFWSYLVHHLIAVARVLMCGTLLVCCQYHLAMLPLAVTGMGFKSIAPCCERDGVRGCVTPLVGMQAQCAPLLKHFASGGHRTIASTPPEQLLCQMSSLSQEGHLISTEQAGTSTQQELMG